MKIYNARKLRRNGAFTLVELVVVIAIIAILASLLMVAVNYALNKGPDFQTRTEIAQLDVAMGSAKGDLGAGSGVDFLPSVFLLDPTNASYLPSQTTLAANSATALQKMFGKFVFTSNHNWFGDGTTAPRILQGDELLVFYLGGIPNINPNGTVQMLGFANNPADPAAAPQINPATNAPFPRKGPYYEFKSSRLVQSTNFYHYLDPYSVPSRPATCVPYAYFSSGSSGNDYNPTDCSNIGAAPYYGSTVGGTIPQYIKPKGIQIMSAGADRVFGPGGLWQPLSKTNASANYGTGNDDYTNFAKGKLGDVGN